MKVSQIPIVNIHNLELLPCIECNQLTAMRNHLNHPICIKCMRGMYSIIGEEGEEVY